MQIQDDPTQILVRQYSTRTLLALLWDSVADEIGDDQSKMEIICTNPFNGNGFFSEEHAALIDLLDSRSKFE